MSTAREFAGLKPQTFLQVRRPGPFRDLEDKRWLHRACQFSYNSFPCLESDIGFKNISIGLSYITGLIWSINYLPNMTLHLSYRCFKYLPFLMVHVHHLIWPLLSHISIWANPPYSFCQNPLYLQQYEGHLPQNCPSLYLWFLIQNYHMKLFYLYYLFYFQDNYHLQRDPDVCPDWHSVLKTADIFSHNPLSRSV